ncbi:MAG: hypothetical protein WBA35_04095 [Litorimonas sp.]
MRHHSLRTLALIALAGSSLSGCAVLGSAADTMWAGTKSVGNFLTTPVGELLRITPAEETQFAGTEEDGKTAETVELAALETGLDAEGQTASASGDWVEVETYLADAPVADAGDVPALRASSETVDGFLSDLQAGAIRVADVQDTTPVTLGSVMSSTSTATVTTSTSSSASTSMSTGGVVTTAPVIETVSADLSSYVRMGGGASLADWRACETASGGYWTFDGATRAGKLNPAFETCMTSQDYRVETRVSTEVIPAPAPVTVTTTQLSSLP